MVKLSKVFYSFHLLSSFLAKGISQTNSKPNETRNTNGENGNTEETLKDNEAPKRNSPDDATPLDETNSETSLEEGEDEDNDAQNTLTKSNIAT